MINPLPLVHLSLLRPLVAELQARGVDPEAVLDASGLTLAKVNDDSATVHVMVVHQFLEECAAAAGDVTLCATVASSLNPSGWPMIQNALRRGGSLADFLSIYVNQANKVSTSVIAFLDVRGPQAIFGETRLFRPSIKPAQNDAYMVSLALSILRRTLGAVFDPKKVILVVCDPSSLPKEFGVHQILTGNEMGFKIRFPSTWLAVSIQDPEAVTNSTIEKYDDYLPSFISSFRSLLDQHISNGGLTAAAAAQLAEMSQSRLARRLAKKNTTIGKEIQRAKFEYARKELAQNDATVEEIAARIGYTDPSNFTRAFRKEFGVTPSTFRLGKTGKFERYLSL